MARTDPQINLRIPAELKARVEAAAARSGRSTNAEVLWRLELTLGAVDLGFLATRLRDLDDAEKREGEAGRNLQAAERAAASKTAQGLPDAALIYAKRDHETALRHSQSIAREIANFIRGIADRSGLLHDELFGTPDGKL